MNLEEDLSYPKEVYLFETCIVNNLFPSVSKATVKILTHLGIKVIIPHHQTCCGQPIFNSGYWEMARRCARHFVDVFSKKIPVVSTYGSCVSMVRNNYLTLLGEDPEYYPLVLDLKERIFELTQFLVDELGFRGPSLSLNSKILLHHSCQALRRLKIEGQPKELLSRVKGATVLELDPKDRCCGFGGLFHLRYSEISRAMLKEKVDSILRLGPDIVTGLDMGCLYHISKGLRGSGIKVMHISEVLAGYQ